jgi:hypothetical protein
MLQLPVDEKREKHIPPIIGAADRRRRKCRKGSQSEQQRL